MSKQRSNRSRAETRNLKLKLAYDGSAFSGLELQPGCSTVRGELEKALQQLFRKEIKIITASRTDAGVHARAQAVNFYLDNKIAPEKLMAALNTKLPPALRVLSARQVSGHFHSRYNAKYKEYEYLIFNGKVLPPAYRDFVWHIRQPIDIKAMQRAAAAFSGSHDFSSFCAAHSDDRDFVRVMHKIVLGRRQLQLWQGPKLKVISFYVRGNGFLYKMVRNMVGTLVEVGEGRLRAEDIPGIIKARDRKAAGRTAPAHGLCLLKVGY
ncbi:MAG: tRNA pseudouridine(38-40) synthase TruA [Candidatus Saganbacteria bacterium]|nr:tRNA pseudouridine(38-40) synthase TruA [Candidatus Saganbacteria bacterium]